MIDFGSFRDPSGFIFYENEKVLRIINLEYRIHFDHLIESGLYENLTKGKKLISYKDFFSNNKYSKEQYKVIEVFKIPFISYAYEWSFSQFKDAALLTLDVEKTSVEYGMMLKDASPYNIQFYKNKPIFIDSLSFEKVDINYNWKAYGQFCEMFLGPLCLMAYKDPRLNTLLKEFINGIPLDLVAKLIPTKYHFVPSVFLHLILHSKIQKKTNLFKLHKQNKKVITKKQHLSIITYLISFIEKLTLMKESTEWDGYYDDTDCEKPGYLLNKENEIETILKALKPKIVWDIGSNDGRFSRISSKYSDRVFSMDFDWRCVEHNYIENIKSLTENVISLQLDLVNPSPSIGWLNEERASIFTRLEKPDLILALAMMHHIINSNIPFIRFLEMLSKTNKHVILEYIPRDDPKAEKIFSSRSEDFKYINKNEFEALLRLQFKIIDSKKLSNTKRELYILEKK